jgi:hypothetical protein
MAAVDRRQVEDGLEEIFRSETGASVRALPKMAYMSSTESRVFLSVPQAPI